MQTRFSHRNRNQTYFKSKPFSTSLLPFSLPWDSAWPHSIHQLRFLGKSSRPGADAVPSDKTLMHLIQQLQGVWPLRIRLSAKLQSSKLNLAIGIHLQTAAVSGCATCEEQIRIRAKKRADFWVHLKGLKDTFCILIESAAWVRLWEPLGPCTNWAPKKENRCRTPCRCN